MGDPTRNPVNVIGCFLAAGALAVTSCWMVAAWIVNFLWSLL